MSAFDQITDGGQPRDEDTAVKIFTVDEANRALALVQRIVGSIVEKHRQLVELQIKCESLLEAGRRSAAEDAEASESELVDQLNELLGELRTVGCELKDFSTGLVDFHGRRNGEHVLLCWRLGEDRVAYWHDLTTGYAGRRPIDEACK
jgi:hypothetical protein